MNIRVLALSILTIVSVTLADEPKPWSERIKLSGDFRYRHETITEESKSDRHRHRIRARLAAQAYINDRIDAYLRVASGKGEPVSTNQDLGGGSGQKGFWLDRAYLDAHPYAKWSVFAGKFGVPLEHAELVWDSDLNLEGVAGRWKGEAKKSGPFVSGGGFWLTESASAPDQGLLLAQAGYQMVRGKQSAMAALAYADYQNLQNHPIVGAARGNSMRGTGTSSVYLYDYNLVQFNLSGKQAWTTSSLTVNGEYVSNTAAPTSAAVRTAALIGLAYKQKLSTFDWELAYNFRQLGTDAAPGEFTDSDFIGGGTNGSGHAVAGTIWPLAGTLLRARYLRDRIDPFDQGANREYGRLMADVEVKF